MIYSIMNKYNYGKIYKITSLDTYQIYIGSTTKTLNKRLLQHINDYTGYLNKKRGYLTSFELIKLNNYAITLVEFVNVETEYELLVYEGYHIINSPNTVNKIIPGRTIEQYANKIMINKYSEGKIYKITSEFTDSVYIGSTIKKLNERLNGHLYAYKSYLNEKTHYITSFEIIKHGDAKITLLELANVNTRDELLIIEGYHIKNTSNYVNKCIVGITKQEQNKEYYTEHKKELIAYQKNYYINNKEKKLEYEKTYNQLNTEKIKQYKKNYNIEHSDELKLKQNEK